MDTISESEYVALRKAFDLYHSERNKLFPDSNWIDAERAKLLPPALSNNQIGEIEVYEWIHNPPMRYFAYVKDPKERDEEDNRRYLWCNRSLNRLATVITWNGAVLGIAMLHSQYRDNFGGIRVSLDVAGNNGICYHGTYYKSSGDYARFTAYKNQQSETCKILRYRLSEYERSI